MPDRIVSEAFAAFLTSNSEFWSHERLAPRAPGAILIEASQNNHGYLYGVLKIGLILARLRGLRPIACPNVRADRDALDLITSMCPDVVPIRRSFVRQLLQRWPCMLALLAKLRTGADLLEASVEGAFVGRYVYDAIIGRFHVPTVGRLTLSMRLYVLWWVAYFYALKEVVDQNDVRFMVLHDPANICGLLFEICRLRRIPCLNGLNLSIMQIRKYYAIGDFDAHCRQIDTDVLARIPADGEWQRRLDVYLERRVNGRIDDHDVVAAYGESKLVRARADLFHEYQLDPGRPLVVVMAHVFADSPHIYPGMLFRDYHEWLLETVRALAANPHVNFVVKEHPAAHLYGEQGSLARVLAAEGQLPRLLRTDLSTATVLAAADFAVTCGGTIGFELSVVGRPVILAARPPYSGLGFAVEPEDADAYLRLLSRGIERLSSLTPDQMLLARKAAFVRFELLNNYEPGLELGDWRYDLGKPFNAARFYRAVIDENRVPLATQRLFGLFDRFEHSADRLILNWSVCQEPVVPPSP